MHDQKALHQLNEESVLTPTYASREMTGDIPKHSFPEQGTAPATVYNLIHDELILDGNSRQNLATFVTTWMVATSRLKRWRIHWTSISRKPVLIYPCMWMAPVARL